jgi:tRNA 5-methylaminomethyl-2-thiouridine biosynthesis bifunctional protein
MNDFLAAPEPSLGRFDWVKTEDGSWSLNFTSDEGLSEMMHHRAGALAESKYIYQKALDDVFLRVNEPRILSVGFGLGYNELLAMESALRSKKTFNMISFEKEAVLFKTFLAELERFLNLNPKFRSKTSHPSLSPYLEIFSGFNPRVCEGLFQYYFKRFWNLRGELNPHSYVGLPRQDLILWDIYSPKIDTNLWASGFLKYFLTAVSAPGAVFVTYACNRKLKDSLTSAGFEVARVAGFANKKHSTWAVLKQPISP